MKKKKKEKKTTIIIFQKWSNFYVPQNGESNTRTDSEVNCQFPTFNNQAFLPRCILSSHKGAILATLEVGTSMFRHFFISNTNCLISFSDWLLPVSAGAFYVIAHSYLEKERRTNGFRRPGISLEPGFVSIFSRGALHSVLSEEQTRQKTQTSTIQ